MYNSNLKIFLAELLGTFGLVIAVTGSIVYDAKVGETLGPVFVVVIHFVGVAIVIYLFGKYSMAHFNPAVTIGYFVAGYTKKNYLLVYFTAQIIGAFVGSMVVKLLVGDYANLGINFPNFSYSIQVFYGIEILATIFLMGVIFSVVYHKKLNRFSGIAIGGIVALDVFFFGQISGASMNPFRSLAPAIISGHTGDLWLYMTAPFIGTAIAGVLFKKITKFKRME